MSWHTPLAPEAPVLDSQRLAKRVSDTSRHQLESVTLVLGTVHGCVYIWLRCVTSLIAGSGAQFVASR